MKEYWIWLSQLPNIGPVLQKKLLEIFRSPKNIYHATMEDLQEIEGIGRQRASQIKDFPLEKVENIIKQLTANDIGILTMEDATYRSIFDCRESPVVFYYRGRLPEKRGIAIVGARRCTDEAKRTAIEIALLASHLKLPVVSGMAKGIDSYAHTACLKEGGYTLAVLACGLDICYPKEHQSLFEKILEKGGAVSAFPPGVKPLPPYFVQRNAHISAWSKEVIIVQAGEKSGSLTTAEFALKQNRSVYVVPHSIYVQEAKGSNQLLEKGVPPYLSPQSLALQTDAANVRSKKIVSPALNPLERLIIMTLGQDHVPIEQLAKTLKQTERNLEETLILMEMNGIIKRKGRLVSAGV